MAETKTKTTGALRTPKPKKKLGLAVMPALRLPHEDLITKPASQQQQSPPPGETGADSQAAPPAQTTESQPVSPTRDFTKVANSIGRQAVPAGLFTGKSKQLYDCLYSLTRGAVVPSRTVRISRPKLMEKSGIGARTTFEANVARLAYVGLIDVRQIPGEHKGNEYTVFLPEEIASNQASMPSLTSLTSPAWKLVRLVRLETSQTRHTLSPLISIKSTIPKTFFKTFNTDDDEAFADFVGIFAEATRRITGQPPAKAERERWAEVARVIVAELEEAAEKTGGISSVPAFLTAHLRRRFAQRPSSRASRVAEVSTAAGGVESAETARRLTTEEIAEQARLIAELLDGGYTMEQAEAQFAGSFDADDWASIKERAAARNLSDV